MVKIPTFDLSEFVAYKCLVKTAGGRTILQNSRNNLKKSSNNSANRNFRFVDSTFCYKFAERLPVSTHF